MMYFIYLHRLVYILGLFGVWKVVGYDFGYL